MRELYAGYGWALDIAIAGNEPGDTFLFTLRHHGRAKTFGPLTPSAGLLAIRLSGLETATLAVGSHAGELVLVRADAAAVIPLQTEFVVHEAGTPSALASSNPQPLTASNGAPFTIIPQDTPGLTLSIQRSVAGPRGASAYEVALANGFIGTEADWLDSLGGTALQSRIAALEVMLADLTGGNVVTPVAPSFVTLPTMTPASGEIGTVFTVSTGSATGYPDPTLAGTLTLNGVDVTAGIEGASYTATSTGTLAWTVRAINAIGTATEAATSVVGIASLSPPAAVAAPMIAGTAVVGETLVGSVGTFSGNPTPTLSATWQRNGVPIFGATGTSYVLSAADEGTTITLKVTAQNSEGSAEATSVGLGPVTGAFSGNTAPVMVSAPTIAGSAVVGQTLNGSLGTWSGSPTPSLTAVWRRDGVEIPGATGTSYTLTAADEGATITLQVIAQNSEGSAAASSAGLGPVSAATTNAPLLLIVAGQSNADAQGTSGKDPAGSVNDITSIGDIAIWDYHDGGGTETFVPYVPGTNSGWDNRNAWGAEAEFARQFRAANPERPIYIFKVAKGGIPIASQAGSWSSSGSGGVNYYAQVRNRIAAVKSAIATANPGTTTDIVTLWNQGEADMRSAAYGASYAANFRTFIAHWRSEIADGPFIATRVRPYVINGAYEPGIWDVRKAQLDEVEYDASTNGNSTYIVDADVTGGSSDGNDFDELHPNMHWVNALGARMYSAYTGTYGNAIFDAVPNAFSFANLTDQSAGSQPTSNEVILTGIERDAVVTVTGGEFRTRAPDDDVVSDWATSGRYHKHLKLQLRPASTLSAGDDVDVVVSVGGVSSTWNVKAEAAASNEAPQNTAAPAITGTFTEGETLSVSDGTWIGTPTPTYAHQWTRDGADIAGATSRDYTLVSDDVGAVVDCNVTATNIAGSVSASASGEDTVAAAGGGGGSGITLVAQTGGAHTDDSTYTMDVPAGTQSGDLMVLHMAHSPQGTTSVTLPAGWTMQPQVAWNSGSNADKGAHFIAWKINTGETSVALTMDNGYVTSVMTVYRGVDQSAPVSDEAGAAAFNQGDIDAFVDPNTLVDAPAGGAVVYCLSYNTNNNNGSGSANWGTHSELADYAEIYDYERATAGGSASGLRIKVSAAWGASGSAVTGLGGGMDAASHSGVDAIALSALALNPA